MGQKWFFGTNSPRKIDQWSPPMMSSDQKILTPQKTAQKRPENGPKWKIAPKWAKNGFLAQTPCEKFWFFGKSSISIKSWRNNRIQVSYIHLGLRSLWGRCVQYPIKRLLQGPESDHRWALLRHLRTSLCQLFWRFCVNISDNSVSTFLTILCKHFGRFCVNIFDDSIFAGKKVEGTECYERAILPEKALREKLETTIENDLSKTTLILF